MADLKNAYETVFILSTTQGEDGTAALVQKFKELIEANGTIDSVDEWGKRRLAYPINKEVEGYYTLINFTSSPAFTAELDRIYKITDGVLRSLIIKKEIKPAKPVKAAKVAAPAAPAAEVKKAERE
ncbi:MAG TPA: 30S ribosomal protein S6 [Oscillospiraceae bacterium]|nr:30S ribosomal protein S6 [Oscillospiraceae bacterium]